MNALRVINVYRACGTWVFDDPDVDLHREPFVAGVPQILGLLRSQHGITGEKFNILFSPTPFPGHHAEAEWLEESEGGNWYRTSIDGQALTGWLCPALLKYFEKAPKEIYVQVGPA